MSVSQRRTRSRGTRWSGDNEYFFMPEYEGFEPNAVVDVLDGRYVGVVFHNFLEADACRAVNDRFWQSTHRKTRGVEAPGFYVGTYHYHKPTETYLDESEAAASEVAEVLAEVGLSMDRFWSGLEVVLGSRGMVVRPAQYNGRSACPWLIRSWHGGDDYALLPHDDRGQCGEPRQSDFEIQGVLKNDVLALNICLENGPGGHLVVWNVQPGEDEKLAFGVQYTGAPYPNDYLARFEQLRFLPQPGDAYVVRGSHIHAVEPLVESTDQRTTAASLFGLINDSTIAHWT